MAFVSSPSPNSTSEVPTVFRVSTASPQVSTTNLSDATVYAFLANQPNGSQLVYEDLEQIHENDLEEMDLKCDHGKASHFVSSTYAHHNRGSSSQQEDDDEDDGAS
nr:hypothetical protein [Tanacetum cinerariifolium]